MEQKAFILNKSNPPYVTEVFADNGEHSHWEVIDGQGEIIWSQDQMRQSVPLEEYKKLSILIEKIRANALMQEGADEFNLTKILQFTAEGRDLAIKYLKNDH